MLRMHGNTEICHAWNIGISSDTLRASERGKMPFTNKVIVNKNTLRWSLSHVDVDVPIRVGLDNVARGAWRAHRLWVAFLAGALPRIPRTLGGGTFLAHARARARSAKVRIAKTTDIGAGGALRFIYDAATPPSGTGFGLRKHKDCKKSRKKWAQRGDCKQKRNIDTYSRQRQ